MELYYFNTPNNTIPECGIKTTSTPLTKKKLLWVGDDYRAKTGYGRVADKMFYHLKKRYNIYNYAIAYMGISAEYNVIDTTDGTNFGFNKLPILVDELKPDIIILLNDSAIISGWLNSIKINSTHKCFIIPYLCTEYIGITEEEIKLYNETTHGMMAMATFSLNEIKSLGYLHQTLRLSHGYSETILKIDKSHAKKLLGIDPNTFVFFSGSKNQPRKRLDIIIRAFVFFLKQKQSEDVLLMLNCGLIGSGWNLKELYKRLCKENNIENPDKHIYYCSNNLHDANKGDNELTIIYNACDVGITTSTGESFGLIPFEQAALGIPQIIPDWGGITESIVHGAIKIKPHDYYVYPVCIQSAGGEAVVVSYKQVAEGMNMYFKNKSLYNSHAESIKTNVVNYSWNNVADQLIQFIDPIITKQ